MKTSIPYRLDLAGGWLDQPMLSRHASGPVITISIEPSSFNERSGMASSTRQRAIELWKTKIPRGSHLSGDKLPTFATLARLLFCLDNPPGTKYFSGSQDAIGIVFPGLNRLIYKGDYWPAKIDSVLTERTLCWLEENLRLVEIGPRKSKFNVLDDVRITPARVRRLAYAARQCWYAILNHDKMAFGAWMRASFEAQVAIFPKMLNRHIQSLLKKYSRVAFGRKLSGAGGGGYLVLVTDQNIPGSLRIKIRRAKNK